MLINSPMIYENIATPNINMKETKIRSKSLLGCRSPKPTVDNEVKV